MLITASVAEVVDALRGRDLLPSAVTDVAGAPGAITAKVAVHELPGLSAAVKFAARLAGAVDVTVTTESSATTLTVAIAATARGLNVSEQVAPVLTDKLRRLPAGLVGVRTAGGRTLVDVDLDEVARRFQVRVQQVELGDPTTITVTPTR